MSSSSSSLEVLDVASRIIFLRVALRLGASAERILTTFAGFETSWRDSASWSKRSCCEAVLGPVMMYAAGSLSSVAAAVRTKVPTSSSVFLFASRRECCMFYG
jgi:hypothetical protein